MNENSELLRASIVLMNLTQIRTKSFPHTETPVLLFKGA